MKNSRIWQESSKTYIYLETSPSEFGTGVFDSTGHEIYEGDILLQHMSLELEQSGREPNLGYVYYDKGSFFLTGGGPLWEYLDEKSSVIAEYKIVGNLRENADLIAKI